MAASRAKTSLLWLHKSRHLVREGENEVMGVEEAEEAEVAVDPIERIHLDQVVMTLVHRAEIRGSDRRVRTGLCAKELGYPSC